MNLKLLREENLGAKEAEKRIRDLAPKQGWIVAQSFTKLQFARWPANFEPAFDRIFAGRIFDADSEVRWVTEDGNTTIWQLKETPGGEYKRKITKYFLWGTYDPKRNGFYEEVVRKLPPQLPVNGGVQNARPYIEVYEYLPARPNGILTTEALTKALNRPRIAAHRFAGVGCTALERFTREENFDD